MEDAHDHRRIETSTQRSLVNHFIDFLLRKRFRGRRGKERVQVDRFLTALHRLLCD